MNEKELLIMQNIKKYTGDKNKELFDKIKYNIIMFFKKPFNDIDFYDIVAYTQCILEGSLNLKPIDYNIINLYKGDKKIKQSKIRNKIIIIQGNEYKICTSCNTLLPIEEFYYNDKSKTIRKSKCKDCLALYYNDNATIKKAYQLNYYYNKKKEVL